MYRLILYMISTPYIYRANESLFIKSTYSRTVIVGWNAKQLRHYCIKAVCLSVFVSVRRQGCKKIMIFFKKSKKSDLFDLNQIFLI